MHMHVAGGHSSRWQKVSKFWKLAIPDHCRAKQSPGHLQTISCDALHLTWYQVTDHLEQPPDSAAEICYPGLSQICMHLHASSTENFIICVILDLNPLAAGPDKLQFVRSRYRGLAWNNVLDALLRCQPCEPVEVVDSPVCYTQSW